MKRKWVSCGKTYILMQLNVENLEPEWHIVGYVLRRKVYAGMAAGWYAFSSTNKMLWDNGVPDMPMTSARDAKALLTSLA